MDKENELLFSKEELEEPQDIQTDFDKLAIQNPYDKLFEEFNSLINQLQDGTSKSKEKIAELIGKANTILTQLDAVTRQLIEAGLPQTVLQPTVLQIMALRNILDNTILKLTNMNKGGKKRKSKKSKKRNSKKRRRKSMKR